MASSTRPYRLSKWGLQTLLDKVTTEFGTMEVWETVPHRCHLGRLRRVGEEIVIDGCNYIVTDVTPCGARCKAGKPIKTIDTDSEGKETVTIKRAKGIIMVGAYVHH